MEKLKDKDWLKKKYVDDGMSMSQIGDLLGCTKHPVYRALKKHGLQARAHTSKYPLLNDKEWLRNEYLVEMKSIKQIAEEINAPHGVVHSSLTHMGIKTRDPKESLAIKYEQGRFGKNASNWRGGRRLSGGGHMQVHQPQHPYCTKSGLVMEHRLVMEKELGRYLKPDELVHHIDGDKLNNTIENLQVVTRSEHVKIHFEAVGKLAEANKLIARYEALLKANNIDYT